MQKSDYLWIGLIVAGVIIWNLLQPTTITTTSTGQPVAGAGVNPFDVGAYSVESLAAAAALV